MRLPLRFARGRQCRLPHRSAHGGQCPLTHRFAHGRQCRLTHRLGAARVWTLARAEIISIQPDLPGHKLEPVRSFRAPGFRPQCGFLSASRAAGSAGIHTALRTQADSAPLGGGSSLDVGACRDHLNTARPDRPAAVRPPLIRAGQVFPCARVLRGVRAFIAMLSLFEVLSAGVVPSAAAQSRRCWLHTARPDRPAAARPPFIRAGREHPGAAAH